MILHFSNKRFCSKRSTLLQCAIWFSSFFFSDMKMHFFWKFHINYYLCTLTLWHIFQLGTKNRYVEGKKLSIFCCSCILKLSHFWQIIFLWEIENPFPYSTGVTIVLFLHGSFGEKSLSFSKKWSAQSAFQDTTTKLSLSQHFAQLLKLRSNKTKQTNDATATVWQVPPLLLRVESVVAQCQKQISDK